MEDVPLNGYVYFLRIICRNILFTKNMGKVTLVDKLEHCYSRTRQQFYRKQHNK